MKRTRFLLLALLMIYTNWAWAAKLCDFEVGGVYYEIIGEKKVAVGGCDSYISSVSIPSSVTYNSKTYSVTTISSEAFWVNEKITSISIPNSVTTIGDYAFFFCYGLTSLTIPNSVTTIGTQAFKYCSGLTSLTIPNSVTEIGESAFYGCSGLMSISVAADNPYYDSRNDCNAIIETASNTLIAGCKNTEIPNSVTTIGGGAFGGCSGLTSLTITNSVTEIGESAFAYCSGLTSLKIPNSVTTIEGSAFEGCSGLTSLTIPNSVTSIRTKAFYLCENLKTVFNLSNLSFSKGSEEHGFIAYYADKVYNYPNGDIIDDFIFYHDAAKGNILATYVGNNTNITLPKNYNGENYSIGASAFDGCTSLTNINIPNSVTTIGNQAFYGCSGLTSITIPNSVTTIGYFAFYGCFGLTSLTIPNSVTTIGDYAFCDCDGLMSISVAADNPYYDSRNDCNAIIETASNTLIAGCKNTEIPNSVTTIGGGAFAYCSGLTSLRIPNSVTTIEGSAFEGCSGLTSLTIPNYVTSIRTKAFYLCENLKTVFNLSNLSFSKGSEDHGYIAYYADKVYNYTNGEILDDFIFYHDAAKGNILAKYLGNNTNITLPKNYNGENYSIGESAFNGCTSLTNINIPNTVTTIDRYAFYNCSGLTSLTIPNSVTTIGQSAFSSCYGLTSLTIPNSVTDIGESAFYGCSGLTSLTIENYDSEIKTNAFDGCKSVKELCINGDKFPTFSELPGVEKIILGDKIKEVAEDAFNNYPVLNTLEFHCKRIYDWNFGTSRITDIIIGEEVSVIFGGAFEDIETLERLKVEAIVPPIADENTFSKLQYRMLEVSVPLNAIDDYKADEVWQKFSSIKGYVPTGIEELVGETHHEINICINANGLSLENAEGRPVAVYTSNGQLVMSQISYNGETLSLPKGIYVVRISDTTKKVVLK